MNKPETATHLPENPKICHRVRSRFKTPKEMMEKATRYFLWVLDNPQSYKINPSDSEPAKEIKVNRNMSIGGLCVYLNICDATWRKYKAKHDFYLTVTYIEKIIDANRSRNSVEVAA